MSLLRKNTPMKLRPHHILDIINRHGHGRPFTPHPYGHALHAIAAMILTNLDLEVELVVGADEICLPCKYLDSGNQCTDVLRQIDPPISKQTYNDDLDRRLRHQLGLESIRSMTIRDYLTVVAAHMPGIAAVCAHPGEDPAERLHGLRAGLNNLGIIQVIDQEDR